MAGSSSDSCFKGGKFSAPGFRFHPTDEELIVYYLKRKICGKRLKVNVIGVVDVYKMDPSELPGVSILKTRDRQWFFLTPRSRKYPNAARSSRGTATGYWKATGKDRTIRYNSRSVGLKKTLVFYRGKAPTGERTDWVMYEYTMDEDELGRCKNAKDYYALYKLFQKSGVGPKNGEEYGAPFQEEEWVDDDDSEDADNVAVPVDPLVHHENSRRVGGSMFFSPVNAHLVDFQKLLHRIPESPAVFPSQINELAGIPQVNSEVVIQSTLVNNSSGEFLASREIGEFLPNGEPYNRHLSFESPVSANLVEAPNLKSALKTSAMTPLVFEKDDYIEMDDLLIPVVGASSTEKSAQLLNHDGGDLNEYDQMFHDISLSFDIEPVFQFQEQTFENQLNNFIDPSPNLDQFPDDLWLQDDETFVFDQPTSSSRAIVSPSSGVKPQSTNPSISVNGEDQEGQEGDGTKSQFSSALWEFIESIPSTPASACEGPLNRTYVRMSSFSRIRFNGTSVTKKNSKVAIARKRSGNRGFLLLSVFGALCAFFWLFVTTVGVLGRPVFS